jgi:hypothetical protein
MTAYPNHTDSKIGLRPRVILFDYVGVEDDLELLGIAPTLPANYRVDRRSASNLAMYKLGSGLV